MTIILSGSALFWRTIFLKVYVHIYLYNLESQACKYYFLKNSSHPSGIPNNYPRIGQNCRYTLHFRVID